MSKLVTVENYLFTIMYGSYYSTVTYGIIGRESAKTTTIKLLLNVHNRIIEILMKTECTNELPLELTRKYMLESIIFQYSELSLKYAE